MNTYDPSDDIRYVTMDRTLAAVVPAASRRLAEQRLPSGYANTSPGTRLRTRTAARGRSSPPRRPVPAVC